MTRRVAAILALALAPAYSLADDFKIEGYADVRLVLPSDDDNTWLEGGLAKDRFARADGDAELRIGEVLAEAIWQAAPEVLAFASLRYDEDQRTPVDLLEAYVRYRPVSTNAWRWSVKAGAFFPPLSLENDEVGWTSTWTLTPAAINTWVGEELRTLGAEGKLELRGEIDTFEANVAFFGWNDPAGVLIDVRGWALHDRPTGLFDEPRLPDVMPASWGPPPVTTAMFKEIDDRVGYYARAAWKRPDWRAELLRYDNRANPAARRDGTSAWRTEFWSVGGQTQVGAIVLIAQALAGETEFTPSPSYDRVVEFWSAFLLAGWQHDQWRFAARGELFGSDATTYIGGVAANQPNYGEHGHAFTLAVAWLPEEWLRLSAEALFIDSYRPQRRLEGLEPDSADGQLQLGARIYF